MSTQNERTSRRWRSTERKKKKESSDSEDSSSIDSFANSAHIKSTSTPLKNKWSSQEDVDVSPERFQTRRSEDQETEESSTERRHERISRIVEHHDRDKFQESLQQEEDHQHEHQQQQQQRRRRRRMSRRRHRHDERSIELDERRRSDSSRRLSETDLPRRSRRSRNSSRAEAEDELPITEILRRSEENVRTKYEKPAPMTELTADKIYIQGRNGFSAVKIGGSRAPRGPDGKSGVKRSPANVERQTYPPIRVAIVAQKFWRNTSFVYQGILAGMAFMHFIMIYVFFNATVEFISDYSTISEIYGNIFSFLVTLCIVSIFDKFDLARFDGEHLREICTDYGKTAIAIPLYLAVFCLHQVNVKTDDQLALMRYYNLNDSLWENTTKLETVLDDLSDWQRITISKDLLALFAWLFVSLGTRDEALQIHLESMEKYAGEDLESS